MKKLIKNNVKVIVAFILGGLIFGSVGVYAAYSFASSEVSYTENNQTSVKSALDDLYTRANTWLNPNNNFGTPQYYAFGTYRGWCSSTDTNCNSYSEFPTSSTSAPSGKNVYAAKYADGGYGYGVCIKRNGTQHCFRGRNWAYEAQHIQKVFSDISCNVNSSSVSCDASDFNCDVDSHGSVRCDDYETYDYCYVNYSGPVRCFEY